MEMFTLMCNIVYLWCLSSQCCITGLYTIRLKYSLDIWRTLAFATRDIND